MSETFDAYVLEEQGPAVSLLGVDSVMAPAPARAQAWNRLGADLPPGALDAITSTHGFSELPDQAGQILAGQVRGRVVIEIGR